MKPISSAALLLAAATATPALAQTYGSAPPSAPPTSDRSSAPAQAQANQAKISPSKGALKAMVELQDAVTKNDFANIPAKVAAAQAVATTKEDRYLVGQFQLKAGVASKNNAMISAGVDAIAGSTFVDAQKVSSLYTGLGTAYYNDKNYPAAQASFQKAVAVDPTSVEAPSLLGEAYFIQGQKAQALTAFQQAIRSASAGGRKPDEALLRRAVGVAYGAESPSAIELSRQWATAYPSTESWRNSIAIYRNLSHPDLEGTIDLLRLMQVTGGMTADDYDLFSRAAFEKSNYNEAQAVLDAGIAAKAVNPASPKFRDLVTALKGKQKATAADLAVATKSAKNGTALIGIGDRYYAMGDYAKAVEAYRSAVGKPGVDPAIANLHIGMALARAGDKPGATAALNAVTGARADIAKYWLSYINQRA